MLVQIETKKDVRDGLENVVDEDFFTSMSYFSEVYEP
jgi:hypothetical protein